MSIFSPAIKQYFKIRWSTIENFVLNPMTAQQQVFNHLIASAQYTEFGRKYNFEKIQTIKEFKQKVPLSEYEDIKFGIVRIMNGEQNIFWPEDISWFAKSSGTTSDKSKFIPISSETLDYTHYKSGKDVLALYLNQFPDSNITGGKCMAIGGSNQINQLTEDSYFGDLSAVMLQNMPFVGQVMRAPSLEVALMSDWEEKIRAIIDEVKHENITYIAGVPTWTLLVIKQMMEEEGTDDLLDIWPNLELYLHGGVSFTPYRKQFEALTPKRSIHFMETYNASEGFFAAQDRIEEPGMLLFLNHGIYYEFMPVELYGTCENPKTLSLDEVELGKNYAIIISTNAGLWRYVVGDTIQFTDLRPYRIKVSGRLKHYINAFGEELIIDNSDYAIGHAAADLGVQVNDYTVAPIYISSDENGAHEWIIEFEQAPQDLEMFTQVLDSYLKKANSDYEAKRHKDIALRLPIIHVMQKGGFNHWLKSKGKVGGQNKVPRLSNDRKYIEEIKKFIQ